MKVQLIQWQAESEGEALFGPTSVLLPEDGADFEASGLYGYSRRVGEVDMDRMVLIDPGPRGSGEPTETPVTLWTLAEQRAKLGAGNAAKESARATDDAAAAARPGASGAKALAANAERAKLRAIVESIAAEKGT